MRLFRTCSNTSLAMCVYTSVCVTIRVDTLSDDLSLFLAQEKKDAFERKRTAAILVIPRQLGIFMQIRSAQRLILRFLGEFQF